MTKTVLLTGAGGSIGCHVLNVLLKQTDWGIIATDSFGHLGYSDRIKQVLAWNPLEAGRVKVITHDLFAPFSDRQVAEFGDVDYIINLASLSDVQGSIDDPVPFVENNSKLMLNMVELARKLRPEKFIQFSTDEVYGCYDPKTGNGHKEWERHIPSNPYSASKAMQEDIACAWWRSYDVPVIIINVMNNFGEMQSSNKYPVKIQKAVATGDEVTVHALADGSIGSRFYMHSEISAEALLFILESVPAYHHRAGYMDEPHRFNVAGDRAIDNLELAQIIADMMGKRLRYKLLNFHDTAPGHDSFYGLDSSKIAALGFQPSRSFEEMMERTIRWQQDHPEWIQ